MNIAIIPARGGSKRIEGKNLKPFLGIPMISRTIQKAQDSGYFDEIYVSSDDENIAALVYKSGANLLTRSEDLSGDFASTLDVMHDAVSQLEKISPQDQNKVVCLYPVTPLLDYRYVGIAIELCTENTEGYIFPAMEFESPVERGFQINENRKIEIVNPALFNNRTQDLPVTFRDAGQFYLGLGSTWLKKIPILGMLSTPVILKRFEVIDVDNPEDWIMAENLVVMRSEAQ